mmetsp:Transcript_13607/g.15293  ORF Transcript_13607/g.15293 Transcript_13607/m.15293 type:complete len:472 (+) Transcript_13607:662-2077(+)
MLTLSKLLIKTPEHLHNRKSGSSYRIREITTWWTYSSYNTHSTLTIRGTKTGYTSGTFVESCKTGTKVGWVTGIGRHLSKTTGNLTKSFGPTRGGISHHRNIHSLITEVLSKSNTSVNGSLASSYRHIRGVGYKSSTLHNTNFTFLLSDLILDSHCKFWEITKYFSHLITTLTASNVYNSIRVRKFRKRLGDNGLSATKGTGYGTGSTKHGWEKSINYTKTSDKWLITWKLLSNRTRATYRPEVTKSKLVCLILSFIEHFDNNIIYKECFLSIGSSSVDLGNGTVYIWWTKNLMLINNFILEHNSNNITSSYGLTFLDVSWSICPANLPGQTRSIYTLWHVNITSVLENSFKRTLDTIENGSHNTGSELYRKRLLLTKNWVTDGKTRSILVYLNGGSISLKLNNLSYKLGVSYTDKLVHCSSRHTIGNHKGTGYLENKSVVGLYYVISEVHFGLRFIIICKIVDSFEKNSC